MERGMETGLVLARASELRAKINHCILDRAAQRRRKDEEAGRRAYGVAAEKRGNEDKEEEEEEEASLLDIRDALESLEQHLSSLQALEQQQRYETEATLSQIDRCRMFLSSKVAEYKGEGFEVIQETLTFASENVKHNDDLLLPPYSNHSPDAFILDDLYPSSHVAPKRRQCQNGLANKLCTSQKPAWMNQERSRLSPWQEIS